MLLFGKKSFKVNDFCSGLFNQFYDYKKKISIIYEYEPALLPKCLTLTQPIIFVIDFQLTIPI